MLNISYNLSPKLNDNLYKIENLRRYILLTPISPKLNLKLRWEASFNRICASLNLSGNPLKKEEILKLLTKAPGKKMKRDQQEAIEYKNALDYISNNWLGSVDSADAKTLIGLYRMIANGRLSAPLQELDYLLDYLEDKQESPVIKAGTVFIELEKMQSFTDKNLLLSLLAANLFLYKYGYDFRGFLAYETIWAQDPKYFRENYDRAMQTATLTLWLEYFSNCILTALEQLEQKVSKPNEILKDLPQSLWELNDRQKSILIYLDKPQVTITNRKVQKQYKVSQITASRDLAKLANLGLLFSHGKGRSVYYSKI